MKRILYAHLKKYPLMQPKDVEKLLYQSEFGATHFLGTEEESLSALREEMRSVEPNESEDLYESIGGGFMRVNLQALPESAYTLERLNRDFTESAAKKTGSIEGLEKKIKDVLDAFEELPFSFDREALAEAFLRWKEAGYPPVSHSAVYRDAYAPHYRVLSRAYAHDFSEEKRRSEPKHLKIARTLITILVLLLLVIGMCALGKFLYTHIAL